MFAPSNDLRQRILDVYAGGNLTCQEVAYRFKVR